jgi:esterase/lipase superfamily enzyme
VPSGGPLILPGIDTIDITSIGASLLALNHSEYAENRLLLDDIGRLLDSGQRPPTERSPTLRRRELQDGAYWYFPR